MRAESLAIDSPGQRLREVRGFRTAWLGGAVDTLSKDRDWMRGDTIVAQFTSADSAGTIARGAEQDRGAAEGAVLSPRPQQQDAATAVDQLLAG